jgi:DNA-binding transcriptional regulator YdaS (Cro superfamily)
MAYDTPLRLALDKVGGPAAMARHLGIGASAVTQWEKVPAKHVGKVGALTGMKPHELRSDLFPAEQAAA